MRRRFEIAAVGVAVALYVAYVFVERWAAARSDSWVHIDTGVRHG